MDLGKAGWTDGTWDRGREGSKRSILAALPGYETRPLRVAWRFSFLAMTHSPPSGLALFCISCALEGGGYHGYIIICQMGRAWSDGFRGERVWTITYSTAMC